MLARLLGIDTTVGEAKAVTGPGVVAMTYDVPITSISRTPQKIAREAQAIYHHNPWAYVAENTVSGTAASVTWHVEDANGTNVTDTHPAVVPLRRPAPNRKRRWLWQLTLRHGGLCGEAFWYRDAVNRVTGEPRGFIYINPARMWDARDAAGNLRGWIMDADRPDGRQPVPFEVEEILHFVYDPDDNGWRGIGIVEAAWRKLHLGEAADIHAEKSLRAGGRKPGIIMPAQGRTFDTDQYDQIVRELRNVTDSPDAAKKSLIFKAPVDYTDAGIDPTQMQLKELLASGRDDALALWKVPPSQIGVTSSGRGLNSGETQKYEEAALWQNAIEPRLDMLRETLQDDYLDGFGLTLVLNTPSFDDQSPLYDLAEKSRYIAVTVDEKRAIVGLPPLGPENGGNLVYLDKSLVPLGIEPDAADEDIDTGGEVKASLHFEELHRRIEQRHRPRLRRALAEVLEQQKADIARSVAERGEQISRKPGDYQAWWNEAREHRRLEAALLPVAEEIASEVGSRTSATFFRPAKASLLDLVLEYVRTRAAARISGINATTREAVRQVVEDGVREGLSPGDLGQRIGELGSFDESRAEMIARTETAYALNEGAIGTYRAFDVGQVQVIDGDADDICAPVNGATWSLEEAAANPVGHPNCTRDFIPIVA